MHLRIVPALFFALATQGPTAAETWGDSSLQEEVATCAEDPYAEELRQLVSDGFIIVRRDPPEILEARLCQKTPRLPGQTRGYAGFRRLDVRLRMIGEHLRVESSAFDCRAPRTNACVRSKRFTVLEGDLVQGLGDRVAEGRCVRVYNGDFAPYYGRGWRR